MAGARGFDHDLGRRGFVRGLSLLPLLSFGCARPLATAGSSPAGGHPPRGADDLNVLAAAYEQLMAEHGLHEWSRYAGQETTSEPAAAMQTLRAREHDVVTRAAALARDPARGVSAREAELWARAARGLALLGDAEATSLADQLEATLNAFVFEHDGKRLSRGDLQALALSPKADERRLQHRLWGQLHQAAAPTARALLRRRRALSAELGLPDFYGEMLALRGVDRAHFDGLLARLEAGTREPYARTLAAAKHAAKLATVAPYDRSFLTRALGEYPDEAFPAAGALAFARAIWGELGVDFGRSNVRIDVRDFAFGGQTISIRIPTDVRVVVAPSPGARFYSTLLHELGHAFAASRTRVEAPVLKGYEWIPGLSQPGYDEGLAEVFGDLLDEPAIMERFGPALAPADRQRALRGRAQAALIRLRSSLFAIAFEREALRNPEQDLDALERTLQREVQGMDVPADVEPTWATSPFLATYPVYTQSYLLAELCSQQLRAALRAQFGVAWLQPQAASWLVDNVIHDAAATTLDQKLTRATGSTLSADPYLAYMLASG